MDRYNKLPCEFDVIVVGAGHAGVESALAAARMKAKTLLITHNIETIGQMSCNPAIGGIGKGHIVKEIDALGGVMARSIDQSGIHFRILNASKGPAVQATRAQADRNLYRVAIRRFVEHQPNLMVFQQPVDDLIIEKDCVVGVKTQLGVSFYSSCVVVTTGTFLNGKMHIGDRGSSGGRAGDPASNNFADKLLSLPFKTGRLKTGTPPRICGKTICYEDLEQQQGDNPMPVFSYLGCASEHPKQVPCYITATNSKTHEIIANNIQHSAMYSGEISGVGPRYCPSIEDKVMRFIDRDQHQIFIEPEGLDTVEIYPNGISTSLPFDIQYDFVRSIKGFENAFITRPGYAIEYDYFDPRGLKNTLETKCIKGLFFAGQINGTTGYEEAAGQGLVAGINAALRTQGRSGWSPSRYEAYIGVMIDDLITKGVLEPYRMFTSRAEYRLQLREDNADERLTPMGYKLGVVSDERWRAYSEKADCLLQEQNRIKKLWIRTGKVDQSKAQSLLGQALKKDIRVEDALQRPNVSYKLLLDLIGEDISVSDNIASRIEVEARYRGYIERQKSEIERQKNHQNTVIPDNIKYDDVKGLSIEAREVLAETRPSTLGQAARIPGVTPATITLIMVFLKKNKEIFV